MVQNPTLFLHNHLERKQIIFLISLLVPDQTIFDHSIYHIKQHMTSVSLFHFIKSATL